MQRNKDNLNILMVVYESDRTPGVGRQCEVHCVLLSLYCITSLLHLQTVNRVIIWGNHSSTQYPDARNATADVNGSTQVRIMCVMYAKLCTGDIICTT